MAHKTMYKIVKQLTREVLVDNIELNEIQDRLNELESRRKSEGIYNGKIPAYQLSSYDITLPEEGEESND